MGKIKKPYKHKFHEKKSGKKEGFCIQEWDDSTTLKGNYIDNKLNGYVCIKTPDGKEFQGF